MKLRFALPGAVAMALACLEIHGAQFKFTTQTLSVPDGFEVELVAGRPLIDRPVYGSFDQQGRLYVVDSSGSNDKPDKQLQDKPHRVMCLQDTKGDGHFDKSTLFADKMMFPEGCLWYEGSVYVAAPPSIWKLTDTDGDGTADKREEWFQGKTLTGCANDLHGPYLGPDGWIYWCKGAFAKQTYDRPGKSHLITRAAHIFRSRPDGTGIEPVLTGGMDNPVSVAFTASGERILCGTFFITHEPGKRDGLIHAIYGGVYGKINDVTDDHPKTGDLMPIMTHMGPAAPCSVIRYESQVFGKEYQDNLFVCSFNMHKVSRHVLEPEGATFKTTDSDFVTSDNPDFHPTDVIEDADGSLLVIDTGGWYKLCCPTSQLPKPDVLGAIYRIRRTGVPKIADPRGTKIAWNKQTAGELAGLLGDDRPVVRKRASQQLSKQVTNAVGVLAQLLTNSLSTEARRQAVWTLTRIDSPIARQAVRSALRDTDETVQQVALHSISLWSDAEATQELLTTMQTPNAQLQRVAAEALGRIGAKLRVEYVATGKTTVSEENSFNWIVPGLLTASAEEHDRVLEHSITYALIETDSANGTMQGLESSSTYEQRTALIALDQMDHGGLKPDLVSLYLTAKDPILRSTAYWVAGHHPDWGGALATFFHDRLAVTNLTADDAAELQQQLGRFLRAPEIQGLLTTTLQTPGAPITTRRLALKAIAQSSLKEPPAAWSDVVRSCFSNTDSALLEADIAAAKTLGQLKSNPPDFSEGLLRIGQNESLPVELRLEALAAIPNRLPALSKDLLAFLCSNVDSSKPLSTRSAAASALSRATLTEEQLTLVADKIKTATPLEVTKLLGAFEQSSNETTGLKLMATLKESKALSSIRPDLLKGLIAKYPEAVQSKGNELLTLLNVDTVKQNAHLTELLTQLKEGDIRRGQAVFNSQKAACFSCHTMGYMGGNVGPDLTSIGQIRTERDLLESVVYPSASFVRSYEPVVVMTKNDQFNGLIRNDGADEILLATGPNAEVRVPRTDIVEIKPSTVSVMPAGLDEQLTRQELADLLAFLKATRWGPR